MFPTYSRQSWQGHVNGGRSTTGAMTDHTEIQDLATSEANHHKPFKDPRVAGDCISIGLS